MNYLARRVIYGVVLTTSAGMVRCSTCWAVPYEFTHTVYTHYVPLGTFDGVTIPRFQQVRLIATGDSDNRVLEPHRFWRVMHSTAEVEIGSNRYQILTPTSSWVSHVGHVGFHIGRGPGELYSEFREELHFVAGGVHDNPNPWHFGGPYGFQPGSGGANSFGVGEVPPLATTGGGLVLFNGSIQYGFRARIIPEPSFLIAEATLLGSLFFRRGRRSVD
jgi:hypothetical protein